MRLIPNLAHERLKRATPASAHPDANLLSAFAEKSLSERERATVFDHLACCRDCRDIVALALPAVEAGQPVIQPSPARWLTWPAVRWGLATAGLAVIATFGVMQYERQHSERATWSKNIAKTETFRVAVKTPPTSAENSKANIESSSASPAPDSVREYQHNPPESKSQATAVHSRSPLDRPDASKQTLRSELEAKNSSPSANALVAEASPNDFSRVGKAKDVAPASPSTETQAVHDFGRLASNSGGAPRWGISATGGLQESFDQGASWQDIDVTAATAVPVGGPLNAPGPTPVSAPHSSQAARPVFRVVAEGGPEVWAGGTGGTLYHSSDLGQHWMPVAVSSSGVGLTGDIVSLEISNPGVKVTTSTAEVWTTADSGQTWKKQ